MDEDEAPVDSLRNLGPRSAEWLRDVGICTVYDLRRIGAVGAWHLVREQQSAVSLNLLYALHAGLTDRSWLELSDGEKQRLRRESEVPS